MGFLATGPRVATEESVLRVGNKWCGCRCRSYLGIGRAGGGAAGHSAGLRAETDSLVNA